MSALQHEFPQQVLEERAIEGFAQRCIGVGVFEGIGCGIVIIEPGGERFAGEHDAVRHAVVALSKRILVAADHRFEPVARYAMLHKVTAGILNHVPEFLRRLRPRVLQDDELIGLLASGRGVARHISAQARGDNRFLDRGLVGAEDRIEEHIGCNGAEGIERLANDIAHAHECVFGSGLHLDALVVAHGRFLHGERVGRERGGAGSCGTLGSDAAASGVFLREVALVKKRELAPHVGEVSIQGEIAIGQVVVSGMRVEELLIGELGYRPRVAAGFERIRRVGEEGRAHGVVQHAHGVGERALHLVEHHAVVAERALGKRLAFRYVELVVPPLLLEDGALRVDGRVEHRVHIDVHEVEQVLLVGGGNGVDGLVRVGHGVQERLHGAFDELNEWLLEWELFRTIEDGVLKDMEHARAVGGWRLEGDGEGLVLVVAGEVEQARAGCMVEEHVGVGIELFYGFNMRDGEAAGCCSRREQRSSGSAGVGGFRGLRIVFRRGGFGFHGSPYGV